jgi:DNA-directed RNA polymerase subunit RPC12/RpoP
MDAPPATPPTPQQLPRARALERPRCAKCGYRLAGLAREGRCPECGLRISESLRRARAVREGRIVPWWPRVGRAVAGVAVCGAPTLVLAAGALGVSSGYERILAAGCVAGTLVLVWVVALAGMRWRGAGLWVAIALLLTFVVLGLSGLAALSRVPWG